MRYLVVDDAGEILADFGSIEELVREPGLAERLRSARGRFRFVRVDEHPGAVLSATSFITTTPLPQVLREDREQ